MNEDKWIELLERIDNKFTMTDRTIEDLEDSPGHIETVVFKGPQGMMKIERTVRPVVLDKKVRFSNRIGGTQSTDYTYHPTEKSDRVRLFTQNPHTEEWTEMDVAAVFKSPTDPGAGWERR